MADGFFVEYFTNWERKKSKANMGSDTLSSFFFLLFSSLLSSIAARWVVYLDLVFSSVVFLDVGSMISFFHI